MLIGIISHLLNTKYVSKDPYKDYMFSVQKTQFLSTNT